MGVLEDIHKSLGGSTATGRKKTPTDAEKLELWPMTRYGS